MIVELEEKIESLSELAEAACERHTEIEAALAWSREYLADRPALWKSLLEPMLISAIRSAIHDRRHQNRTWAKHCTRG